MTQLIDKDKAIVATWIQPTYTDPLNVLTKVRDRIRELPIVDAVPVRHGKWLPENRTMDAFWVCSCCGFPSESHGAFKIYKFCPNCGARMDEADDE